MRCIIKNPTQIKLTILWGLPGSGKTTYCEERGLNIHNCSMGTTTGYINGDQIAKSAKNDPKQCREFLFDKLESLLYSKKTEVVLDGLFTTNEGVKSLIGEIEAKLGVKYKISYHIIWWPKNIDACLWNDRGRRKINSEITIRNLPFDEPNADLLGISQKNIERKRIVKKPSFVIWSAEAGFSGFSGDKNKLKSSCWSLGGTSGSCWGGSMSTVTPSPQPISFEEFDQLLEQTCPEISLLKYKNLYAKTVTVETEGCSDYYGGYTTSAWYECDLEKLYSLLLEMNLIQGVNDES